jgi:hypothetical protein
MKIFKMLFSGFVFVSYNTKAQTLRINEFSNGSSGAREWVELLVVPTTPVAGSPKTCFLNSIDVSGWILDDNNGDFSPAGHYTGSGMASGHIRFKNTAPWTRLPMGALIVIYNADDKDPLIPADDPLDINNDCVYIMPSSHSSIEYCTTGTGAPQAIDCVTRLDYADCSSYGNYIAASGLRSWSAIGLANNGDGIQIRNAAFSQIHGVVYGNSSSSAGCATSPPLVGNAVTPYLTGSGTNRYFAYTGTDVAGYFTATNWVTGTASAATPGTSNNTTNQSMIDNEIRKGCICDMTLPLTNPVLVDGKRTILPYIIKQTGTDLLIQSGRKLHMNISIYSTDGSLLEQKELMLQGTYRYPMQHRKPCLVHITSQTTDGRVDQQTVKFF